MSFASMCLDATPIDEIGSYLDALSHKQRLVEMFRLSASQQASLFEKAADAEPLSLDFFVPHQQSSLTQVIHHGKNSLPVFRYFQKRFCLPVDRDDCLYGYNEAAIRHLIGPGYFVAYSTQKYPTWRPRGGVVVDYFRTPESQIVRGWPVVSLNSEGLQRFVYHRTRDFMRRVSHHVSIGAAWKEERPMGAYFLLCREEVLERKAIESSAGGASGS